MNAVRAPRSVAQATALLDHYAELADAVAHIENGRNAKIAQANASADAERVPLLAGLEEIRTKLEPWWQGAGPALAGKRKAIERGGCMVGTRLSRAKLAHGFEDEDKAVEAQRGTRYQRQTVRVRYSIDRTGTVKLLRLGGRTAETLEGLGFSIEEGADVFFVERAEQVGTIGR